MRTNIVIDDDVLDAAMRTGPFKTKKEAVDAGLRLLARQAAYREILRYEGKLKWDGDVPALHSQGKATPSVQAKPATRASRAKR
jgi:Arc/MetJ family transcription regulator